MKTWFALMTLVLADVAGSLFLTRGMKQVGEVATLRPQELLRLVGRAVTNPMIGLGIFFMAVAFFMFIALLSWADLSFVQPATALTYPINVLGARYILKERVTGGRFIGTLVICLGIALISLSSSSK